MADYEYLDNLEKIAEILRINPNFVGWTVTTGFEDLQPENLPAIEVLEGEDEETPVDLPGWRSGGREFTVSYRFRFLTYSVESHLEARKQLQNGRKLFQAFLRTNPTLAGVVDQVQRLRGRWDSNAEAGGYVAALELTLFGLKVI